mgnify:CR=1 FL=1
MHCGELDMNLNTSHVLINRHRNSGRKGGESDLNTSHVLINLYDMLAKRIMNTNLNTSHVLINPLTESPAQ